MVQINFGRKEINCKIVYYGPGLSGKTTNLEKVHESAPDANKGELTSISTDGDRTLFFDFMPLDLGNIAGMKTKFHIYTVPGQVYYNSTRKLVLLGADGVIFVADSSPGAMEGNLQSLENLKENLVEMGKDVAKFPLVIQYNKRDVKDAMDVKMMEKELNTYNAPSFEAVASTGDGVVQTLKAISSLVLEAINSNDRSTSLSQSPAVGPTPEAVMQASRRGATEDLPSEPDLYDEKATAPDTENRSAPDCGFEIERNHIPVTEPCHTPAGDDELVAVAHGQGRVSGGHFEDTGAEQSAVAVMAPAATLTKEPAAVQAPRRAPTPKPKAHRVADDEAAETRRATQQERVNTLLRKERAAEGLPKPTGKLPPRDIKVIGGKPGAKRRKSGGTNVLVIVVLVIVVLAAAGAAYLYMM